MDSNGQVSSRSWYCSPAQLTVQLPRTLNPGARRPKLPKRPQLQLLLLSPPVQVRNLMKLAQTMTRTRRMPSSRHSSRIACPHAELISDTKSHLDGWKARLKQENKWPNETKQYLTQQQTKVLAQLDTMKNEMSVQSLAKGWRTYMLQ